MSGTSMSAPIVTGVASLVWAANGDLTGLDVKRIVCDEKNTVYPVADNTSPSHPLVNTYRMVNANLAVQAALNASLDNKEPVDNDGDILGNYQLENYNGSPAARPNFTLLQDGRFTLEMHDGRGTYSGMYDFDGSELSLICVNTGEKFVLNLIEHDRFRSVSGRLGNGVYVKNDTPADYGGSGSTDDVNAGINAYISRIQDQLDIIAEAFSDLMSMKVLARDGSLLYSYQYMIDVEIDNAALAAQLDASASMFTSILAELRTEVPEAKSVIVEYLDINSNMILSREYR